MDSISIKSEFAQAARVRGVIADVARRLKLSHEHVRQVAHGNRVSKRVQRALVNELRRRSKKVIRELAA